MAQTNGLLTVPTTLLYSNLFFATDTTRWYISLVLVLVLVLYTCGLLSLTWVYILNRECSTHSSSASFPLPVSE
jgi:hypothetical protein